MVPCEFLHINNTTTVSYAFLQSGLCITQKICKIFSLCGGGKVRLYFYLFYFNSKNKKLSLLIV